MKRESEDKAGRILSIYSRLKQGKVIYKNNESMSSKVAERTIQRDIADIENFLQNQHNETGLIEEIVYDKKAGGYRLETRNTSYLSKQEVVAACKVLLESRSLIKEEMFPLINKLIQNCNNAEDTKMIKEMIENEMYHYIELQHGKKLLNDLWEIEQAVRGQQYMEIQYKKVKNAACVSRKVKPVGIMFSEFYFYMAAYIVNIDKEKVFQNPNDTYPTIYRVDRLEKMKILQDHFNIPYAERFEEGEFRKRVQFMYGGRLRRIRFKYCGCIESVLDRFPTAEIIGQEDDGIIVQAEVFGEGADKWLRGEGEKVQRMM